MSNNLAFKPKHEHAGAISFSATIRFNTHRESAIGSGVDARPAGDITIFGIVTCVESDRVFVVDCHAGGAGIRCCIHARDGKSGVTSIGRAIAVSRGGKDVRTVRVEVGKGQLHIPARVAILNDARHIDNVVKGIVGVCPSIRLGAAVAPGSHSWVVIWSNCDHYRRILAGGIILKQAGRVARRNRVLGNVCVRLAGCPGTVIVRDP